MRQSLLQAAEQGSNMIVVNRVMASYAGPSFSAQSDLLIHFNCVCRLPFFPTISTHKCLFLGLTSVIDCAPFSFQNHS